MDLTRLRLREYLRVSQDESGRERSPKQQHGDHLADTREHGFDLHPDPYGDVGSASIYETKERADFRRMMADLQGGTFNADGLCLWEGSRGSRKVSEWALLIELLAEMRKCVWVHTHRRLYDMTNARDRRTLQEEAVDAEYESAKTSERLRRDAAANAAAGGASGRVSYGLKRKFDPKTGKPLGRVKDAEKARHVRDLLFKPFIAGVPLKQIERDWAKRGIVNGVGNPFTAEQLRQMLRNRQYIGERVHLPGRQARWWMHPDEVRISKGNWPAIVTRKVFFEAQMILNDPTRKTTRPGRGVHELSLIGKCDVCSGYLRAATKRGKSVYQCQPKGCATVRKDELDEVARERIFDYLSSDEVYMGLLRVEERDQEELGRVKADLVEAQAEHQALKAAVKAKRLSIEFAADVEPDLAQRIVDLKARVDELTTPAELRGWLGSREDVEARWEAASTQTHRRIAKLVLSPRLAGELRVTRSPLAGRAAANVPVGDRVKFRMHAVVTRTSRGHGGDDAVSGEHPPPR